MDTLKKCGFRQQNNLHYNWLNCSNIELSHYTYLFMLFFSYFIFYRNHNCFHCNETRLITRVTHSFSTKYVIYGRVHSNIDWYRTSVCVIPVLVLVVGTKCLFTYLGSREAVSNVPLERLCIKCFKRRNFFGVHSL